MPHFKKKLAIVLVSLSVVVALLTLFYIKYTKRAVLDYSTYEVMLKNRMIDRAKVQKEYILLKSGDREFLVPKEMVDLKDLYKTVPVSIEKDYSFLTDMLVLFLFAFFIGYIIYYLKKQSSQPLKHQIQIAPMNAPEELKMDIRPQVTSITFRDVAGIDEVKEELEEIIEFLKDPKKYIDFGIRMPRGVLLVGPPGVGKTLIAKAVAGEAGVPFFYQSGSSFVQIYVGMGAKRVRELFKRAKQMAPSIIFIDEIDAVGKARGGMRNDEREATLNQLLTEMDGFEERDGVVVIGATNKIEVLDEALLRPGRFDRRVFVSLPDKEARKKILSVYLERVPHHVDVELLAQISVGFSGAALAAFVNEAALYALKKGKKIVEMSDFEAVKEKVLYGKKKMLAFSDKEKEIQSYYQAAKALAAHWYGVEFDKITLVGGNIKEVDKEISSKSDFLAKIKVYLAGYVALRLLFNEEFSNAAEDLQKAKLLAEEMVMRYGMGRRIVANIEDALLIFDEAIAELEQYITNNRELLEKIAQLLRTKEVIKKEELRKVLDALF